MSTEVEMGEREDISKVPQMEQLALKGGLWSVKHSQVLLHSFPHWQNVSLWDFLKGALQGVQNKKRIGKKAEEILEVKGRGHQEFPSIQKRQ